MRVAVLHDATLVPRAYGMDAGRGANPTAAVWLAHDRDSGVLHAYCAYRAAAAEPAIHAVAIKARGSWIPGVGDCAALIMTNADAEQLVTVYKRLRLDLTLPDKAVETGIQEVWELFSTGRLRVFRHACASLLDELRVYRRDEKGRVVKLTDSLSTTAAIELSSVSSPRYRRTKAVGEGGQPAAYGAQVPQVQRHRN